jgi:hypothetical protein
LNTTFCHNQKIAVRGSQSPAEEQPLVVFLHLRKTAGSTVRFVARRQYRRGELITFDAPPAVGGANRMWNDLPAERRTQIKCVQGHFPFAPNLFAPRTISCLTILRDPVQRVVSFYFFNLHNPETRFHAAINRNRLTLEQFVQSEQFAEIHNLQTRMLAGANADSGPSEMLDTAIANLRERFAVVGVSERLDETLLLCRAKFGWRRLVYRRINVTHRRPQLNAISAETIAAIERANTLDRTLYNGARERMDQLVRENHIADSAVAALQRASRVYSAARRVIGWPRELWMESRMAKLRRRIALVR